MAETRQETAADVLRVAAGELRENATRILRTNRTDWDLRPDFACAVADWLDRVAAVAEREDYTHSGTEIVCHAHALAVAAAVLGRTWPS